MLHRSVMIEWRRYSGYYVEMKHIVSKAEDRLIIELCKANIDSSRILNLVAEKSIDWAYLARVSGRHNVAALIFERLLQLPLCSSLCRRLSRIGKPSIIANLHDNRIFLRELKMVAAILESRGIPCLLLKGVDLDFCGMRNVGDIDLLVKPHQMVSAIEAILTSAGYEYHEAPFTVRNQPARVCRTLTERDRERIRGQLVWNYEYHVFNPELGVLVELHSNLFRLKKDKETHVENIDSLLAGMGTFWEEKKHDAYLGCNTLCPEHTLTLMCVQNAIKRQPANNNWRLSNIVDIDAIIRRGIDDSVDLLVRQCA